MQLRGHTTTFQMRLEISEYAAAGWNDTQIAMAIGCSVWTVRKWRRRWRKLGPHADLWAGLDERRDVLNRHSLVPRGNDHAHRM